MGNAHPNTTEASADLAAELQRLRAENAELIAANALLIVRCDALLAFFEDVRDHNPAIISGRHNGNRDPQDEVPDMIEADTFYAFQEDAAKLAPNPKKPKDAA